MSTISSSYEKMQSTLTGYPSNIVDAEQILERVFAHLRREFELSLRTEIDSFRYRRVSTVPVITKVIDEADELALMRWADDGGQ